MQEAAASAVDRIELMQTFVRIVEAGSLSAAATQLGASQPTVSRRLQALERFLGVKLLRRSTHAMKLTEDGERCYARARELLEDWHAMEAELRGTREAPQGLLRVVVPHAFGQTQLVAPVVAYLQRYPQVSVEWLLHDRRPDFVAEGIDCAIQVGAVDLPSVVAVQIAEVPRIVVAAPALMGSSGVPQDADALAALPWLAIQTFYRDEVSLRHRDDGRMLQFPIQPRLSTDSLYALRNAALLGLGACITSSWVVAQDVAEGRLLHLAPDWRATPLPVYLVYPPARHPPAKLQRFIEAMRDAGSTMAGVEPLRSLQV
ncbi:transcriptional regulator, LysR family [Pseudoxanthomonas sp. GM95]|uniref:LysR family transcriptional regulator n=1 Tax=Pseudoxanthomonas sp. GM95 TaxID=1881043 RepID=UPI0008D5197C|nr:LysR family transcriptional regulator [Pseudoxanthomonas sp. GM95]SEK98181.1 transcriptional regulator, LysR family [Pseudoxanthomonas sp. GM95]